MKNHKKVMLSLALVAIIAIAAIGIGYAYQARTTNTDNTVGVDYIALKQGGAGEYKFIDGEGQTVYWDSDDGKTTGATPYYTDYTLTRDTQSITIDAAYTVVQIGNSFTLQALPSAEGKATADLTCKLTSTNVAKPAVTGEGLTVTGSIELIIAVEDNESGDIDYFKVTGANQYSHWTGSVWDTATNEPSFTIGHNDTTKDEYYSKTVSAYIGYLTSEGKIRISSATNINRVMNVTQPMASASLSFVVDVGGTNSVVTAFTLSKDAVEISTDAGSDTVTVASVTPSNANDQTFTVSVPEGTHATVTVTGKTITVTADGANNENFTVTVKSHSDPTVTQSFTVVITGQTA